VLGVAAILVTVYRIARRADSSVPLTVLPGALGAALVVRTPWLGDNMLDRGLYSLTGWWNLPDLAGHLLAFVAVGAGVSYLLGALPWSPSHIGLRVSAGVAVFMALCVFAFVAGGGFEAQATNMVALPGMGVYALAWSLCLLAWHLVTGYVAVIVIRGAGPSPLAWTLTAAAAAGTVMAVHRVAAVVYPQVYDWHYSALTWLFTVLTIVGYLSVAVLVTRGPVHVDTGRGRRVVSRDSADPEDAAAAVEV
jgi:hypothetical protein